jgi:ribosomal protein S27E
MTKPTTSSNLIRPHPHLLPSAYALMDKGKFTNEKCIRCIFTQIKWESHVVTLVKCLECVQISQRLAKDRERVLAFYNTHFAPLVAHVRMCVMLLKDLWLMFKKLFTKQVVNIRLRQPSTSLFICLPFSPYSATTRRRHLKLRRILAVGVALPTCFPEALQKNMLREGAYLPFPRRSVLCMC